MAKSVIVNRIGGKNYSTSVPTSAVNAETFAAAFLDGEYAIYEQSGVSAGVEVVTVAPTLYNVMFQNTTTKDKSYARFVVPASMTENDLYTALMGKTLNGVHIDYVYTMSQRVLDTF